MIGDVIYVAKLVIAPAMVGAANGVAFYLLAILHYHRAGAGRNVRPHMAAVCVQHDRFTAFAAVQGQIATPKTYRHGSSVQL